MPETLRPFAAAAILGVLCMASGALAQTPLVKDSPFQAASAPTAAAVPAAAFELTGVAVTPDGSRLCIFEAKAGHSRWIPVGATSDGIQILSYDTARKQAVISVDGRQQTLVLRETAAAADLSAPAPTTPEAKAREARLLTGDLLDIGLQQRQAYAAAKKAAGN